MDAEQAAEELLPYEMYMVAMCLVYLGFRSSALRGPT